MEPKAYLQAMTEQRIEVDPEIQHGKPVISGTRVPVHILVGSVAGGMQIEELAREYGVDVADVQAALEYASRLVSEEDVTPLHA
jgi:uncharacterized protein (DUF433 family)